MPPVLPFAKPLIDRKLTLAVAESCTGGLLSHTLTNIAGSSQFFALGVIAYDNKAKIQLLGVPAALIRKHGAVSEPVCQKMAEGVRKILKNDIGVGITGIAGPSGGTKTKPVGLVYIAVTNGHDTVSRECRFKGNRITIKHHAATAALAMISQIARK